MRVRVTVRVRVSGGSCRPPGQVSTPLILTPYPYPLPYPLGAIYPLTSSRWLSTPLTSSQRTASRAASLCRRTPASSASREYRMTWLGFGFGLGLGLGLG